MERLTEWDEFGNADIIGVNSADLMLHLEYDELNLVTDALNRLAAYEDTGLTPAEVAELARVKADGRLVVLPCKPGGFWLRDGRRYCVTHVSIGESGITYVHYFEDGNGKLLRCNSRYFVEHFTREEAEAALAKEGHT